MKKVIIYGLGKRYEMLFNDKSFCEYLTNQIGIDVIGLSDGNINKWGSFVLFSGIYKEVNSIKGYEDDDYDNIIITSNIHFEEIKRDLIAEGISKEKIYSINKLLESYLEHIYVIEDLAEKKGIEIGGPTKLFQCIYDVCSSCDDVNFANETVWWSNNGGGV